MQAELRDLSRDLSRIELRSDTAAPTFGGYAAVFNTRAAIGNPLTWGFYEQIDPSAFTKTIGEQDQRFLIDHDPSKLIARRSAGDLRLSVDDDGLCGRRRPRHGTVLRP
jgi:HK97 family phage prohead protease